MSENPPHVIIKTLLPCLRGLSKYVFLLAFLFSLQYLGFAKSNNNGCTTHGKVDDWWVQVCSLGNIKTCSEQKWRHQSSAHCWAAASRLSKPPVSLLRGVALIHNPVWRVIHNTARPLAQRSVHSFCVCTCVHVCVLAIRFNKQQQFISI